MIDEKLDAKVARGRKAEEIITNPLFEEAWSLEIRRLTNGWVNPPPNQTPADREALHQELRALKNVRQHLTKWMREGESAAVTMAEQVAKANGAGERSGS